VTSAPDVSGYSITGICGRGGFGVVYRAWQQAVGREVAPVSSWSVEVRPPDETQFEDGARYYRCVAMPIGFTPRTLFGP